MQYGTRPELVVYSLCDVNILTLQRDIEELDYLVQRHSYIPLYYETKAFMLNGKRPWAKCLGF